MITIRKTDMEIQDNRSCGCCSARNVTTYFIMSNKERRSVSMCRVCLRQLRDVLLAFDDEPTADVEPKADNP